MEITLGQMLVKVEIGSEDKTFKSNQLSELGMHQTLTGGAD